MLPSHFNFLTLLILFVVLPLSFLWIKYGQTLKTYKKTLILTALCCVIFGGVWQHLVIRSGAWNYLGTGTTNIWFFGLPLEEHLYNLLVGSLITHVTLILKYKSYAK